MTKYLSALVLGVLLSTAGCEDTTPPPPDAIPSSPPADLPESDIPASRSDASTRNAGREDQDAPLATPSELQEGQDDSFVQGMQEKVAEMEEKLDSLKSRAALAGEDAKDRFEALSADLRDQIATLKAELAEMKDASADSLARLKEGAQSAFDDLKEAYDDVAARIMPKTDPTTPPLPETVPSTEPDEASDLVK